jgi:hypothetical protein
MIKLKNLVESSVNPLPTNEDAPRKLTKEEKKSLADLVHNYNEYGKSLQEYGKVIEVADTLKKIAEYAETYVVNECDDWTQANVAKRHFSEIKKHADTFKKLAKEAHEKNVHMTSLYEDVGGILEKYFEIKDLEPK